jgi:hypothetical protein
MPKDFKKLVVRIRPLLFERLLSVADETGESISSVVRDLLMDGLDVNKIKPAKAPRKHRKEPVKTEPVIIDEYQGEDEPDTDPDHHGLRTDPRRCGLCHFQTDGQYVCGESSNVGLGQIFCINHLNALGQGRAVNT